MSVKLNEKWEGRWINIRDGGEKVMIIMEMEEREREIFVREGMKKKNEF